jgi:Fe-S cluster assembly protein SufD
MANSPKVRTPSKLELSLLELCKARLNSESEGFGPLRRVAFAQLESSGLPAKKDEAFRFSPIGTLAEQALDVASIGVSPDTEASSVALDPSALRLAIVNGVPVPTTKTMRGVKLQTLKSIAKDVNVASKLGTLLSEQDGWIAANTSGFGDGWAIVVDDGVVAEVPVELSFHQGAEGATRVALPRVLVILGKGSRLSLIERHLSSGDATSLSNGVIEALLGDGAVLQHSRWVDVGRTAHSLCATAVSVGENATYHAWSLAAAGRFLRHDLQVRLSGRAASTVLDGLYYGRESQLVDNHVRVWHEQPEGTTKECYRGVVEDHGRAVFDGIIYVGKGAMKTDARQENRNLLLGPDAVVNTKPHLEIDADDVSCSHGATVGQLDDSQLFYLRARGIDEATGRALLTWAFAKEIVDRCPHDALRSAAVRRLEGALSFDSDEAGKL